MDRKSEEESHQHEHELLAEHELFGPSFRREMWHGVSVSGNN
jgi:hypothetical protein